MTLVAFGPRWRSELTEDAVWVKAPVGQTCIDCDKQLDADSQGFFVPAPDEPEPALFVVPVHLLCYAIREAREMADG